MSIIAFTVMDFQKNMCSGQMHVINQKHINTCRCKSVTCERMSSSATISDQLQNEQKE